MEPDRNVGYQMLAIAWAKEEAVPEERDKDCHGAEKVGKAAFEDSLPISACNEIP